MTGSHHPTDLDTAQLTVLARARYEAVQLRPYFASILFAMRPLAVEGLGTVAVDAAGRLYVDFDVFTQWTLGEQAGALIHEATHLLRDHSRRSDRLAAQPFLWNVAADAEINDDIDVTLPTGAITPSALGYPGDLVAEVYYHHLVDDGVEGTHPDCGSCAGGPRRQWELGDVDGDAGLGEDDLEVIRGRVAAEISQQDPGTVPAGDVRWAKAHGRSKVNWRAILRRAVTGAGRGPGSSDWTYSRPSRRRVPGPGILRPSTFQPKHTLAVIIDTSGSMDSDDLSRSVTDVIALCSVLSATTVKVISCDATASLVHWTGSRSVALVGGGGTDLREAFALAETLRPRPSTIVCCTDGYTPWPERSPHARTIVVLTGSHPLRSLPPWVSAVVEST